MEATPVKPRQSFKQKLIAIRDRMEEQFASAISRHDRTFDADGLVQEISNTLIRERREMVLKVMGFDTAFGRLELRDGRTRGALQNFVEEKVNEGVQRWAEENPDFFEEAVREALKKKSIRTSIQKRFTEVFEWRMREHAEELARKMVEEEGKRFEAQIRKHLTLATPED